jgi:hypothetical protein
LVANSARLRLWSAEALPASLSQSSPRRNPRGKPPVAWSAVSPMAPQRVSRQQRHRTNRVLPGKGQTVLSRWSRLSSLRSRLPAYAYGALLAQDQNDIKKISPNPHGIPGSELTVTFGDIVLYGALFCCVIGGVIAVGRWVVSKRSHSAVGGAEASQGLLIAVGGAVLLSILGAVIVWAYNTGNAAAGP